MAAVRISEATFPGIVLWSVFGWVFFFFCCFWWAFFFFGFSSLFLFTQPPPRQATLAEHKAEMPVGDHPVQFSSAESLLNVQLTRGVHFVFAHFLSNSHAFISPKFSSLRKEVYGYVTTHILSLNWSPKLFQKLYSS